MTVRADELAKLVKEIKPYIQQWNAAVANIEMSAPIWQTARIVGTQLQLDWNTVPGAAYYEVVKNTVASATGMVLLKATAASQYFATLNATIGELLQNSGFESGDFTGWVTGVLTAGSGVAADATTDIASSEHHSRTYSLHHHANATGSLSSVDQLSTRYTINPLQTLTVSGWIKTTITAGTAHAKIFAQSWKADGTWDNAVLIADVTATSGWTKFTGTIAVGVDAATCNIYIETITGLTGTIEAYYDDMSLIGQAVIQTTGYVYAVRAVNQAGVAGPLSVWLQAACAPSALGDPSGIYLALDFDNARVVSSLQSPSAGATLSPQGLTTTGWEVPLDGAVSPAWETWVYASASSFTIVGDSTSRYFAGVKLRWKQGGGWKYSTVASSSAASGTTTVVVAGGDTVANSAISDNYYSYALTPQGVPVASSVIAARAYHNTTQTSTENSWVSLALNSERLDTDTIHDTATNNSRLTCKTAGIYQISGNASWANGGSTAGIRALRILLNGTTVIGETLITASAAQDYTLNVSTVYELAVNDYVQLQVYCDNTGVGSLTINASGNYSPEFGMAKL
jgi:hypothetical protein